MSSEVSMPGAEHDREPTVEELKRALAEAREEQAATAEILRVISSSPMDLKRVLAELAASAAHHCGAYDASIFQVDGDFLRLVSHYGPIPALPAGDDSLPLTRSVATGRAVLDRRTIHVADMQAAADEYPESRARSLDFRTILAVPLIRAGKATGAIGIRRTEAKLFSDKQIALLETFANQAVIAIENTRLFEAEQASKRELQESLEYQTAISEVLAVISRSPSDLKPVLEAIVETAARLCQADKANIRRKEGDDYHTVASIGFTQTQRDFIEQTAVQLDRSTIAGRVALDLETVHIADVLEDRDFRTDVLSGINFRTGLGVPLLRTGELVGVLLLSREKRKPFTRRQIELVETFADQAVIAIENTRLFEAEQARSKELRESLEYQTATSDVLGIISRSPSELQPVFDGIVTTAQRLCEAYDASIILRDGDRLKLKAHVGPIPMRAEWPLGNPGLVASRSVMDKTTVHVHDLAAPGGEFPEGREDALKLGHRSILAVPLVLKGEGIGTMIVRRFEVRPFGDRQIALLATFADQAVIAIENTRLFEAEQASKRELQESLEYQTATSDVLSVISRSPSDLQPVLDVIVETAARLCQADIADFRLLRDGLYHIAATTVNEPTRVRTLRENPIAPGRNSIVGRVALERRTVHVPDIHADPEYNYAPGPTWPGMCAILGVPLLRDGEVIGVIVLFNSIVKPFTQKQIALVTTFANQAVIAIENTRLFEEVQARTRELTESLEQQTATADVLKVISRSALDVQKVLDALVESAARLCNAYDAAIFQVFGDSLRLFAHHGQIPLAGPVGQHAVPLKRGFITGRAVLERRTIQVVDMLAERQEYPESRGRALQMGFRTALAVPLVHAGEAIGVIFIRRREVRPFTERQIELVNTFADQAVIAIENTRLFEAEQARTREVETKSVQLAQSLEYQTATSDVLAVISRSKFDLQPIIDTIVETATRLCQAERGALLRFEDGGFRLLPTTGAMAGPVTKRLIDRLLPIDRGSVAGRVAIERRTVHILDLQADPDFTLMRGTEGDDRRTCLGVPLIAGNGLLGALILQRTEVRPFTQEQIKLVETFGDQAVIAFENTRLFDEIVSKSRELEIASQHKSQFVANMSHELRTPLAAILGYAELMQEGFYGQQSDKSLEALIRIRSNGKHLLGLINTVLDIAKIESGQFILNMAEYAIESVVETVRSATESLAQNKKLALKTDVAKSLPIGLGDEQRLTQVLLNLVGNAIKFTDAGEVRVRAAISNSHFAVSVTDTGPGIPEEHQERIFEQFHQVDSSNTKAKGGTGLGLAIAKQIVEMHGGRIWVESTLGKGSTFQMEFPIRAASGKRAP
jgi:GAF domain-containing protein/anti-sigma regulatory factor (Ser/Thr protein kinase)